MTYIKDITERFPDPLGDELPLNEGDIDEFEGGLIDWHSFEVDEVDEVSVTHYGTYGEYQIIGSSVDDSDEEQFTDITICDIIK